MSRSLRVGIVNAITFARVPLILGWAALAVWQEFTGSLALAVLAAAAMLLAGLTDLWDGMLARRWGVVSTLGKMADPLMDKAFSRLHAEIETDCRDAAVFDPAFENAFDAVLLDVPCSGFGAPMFVRWTYAASMENIKEGLDRLEKFVQG